MNDIEWSWSAVWDASENLEEKQMKLEAQTTMLGYVLEGLEGHGFAAKKGEDVNMSCRLASIYPMYSQMLFLILQDLKDFTKELQGSVDGLRNISARIRQEKETPCTTAVQSTVQEAR